MPKDFQGTISYWRDPGDGSGPDPEHDREIVLGHRDEDNRQVTIHDIRGTEQDYELDVHGFTTTTFSPKADRDARHHEGEEGSSEYFEEVVEKIKEMTGAKHALTFGRVIRQLKRDALEIEQWARGKVQPPNPRPHVDVAASSGKSLAILRIPEAEELINATSRWQILTLWRPTKGPVVRDPLAVSDFRSIPGNDYRDFDLNGEFGKKAGYVGTTIGAGNGSHKWHYWSDMGTEEALVFKMFDSDQKGGNAWRCAHSSVAILGTEDLPARESIEVRVLVLY